MLPPVIFIQILLETSEHRTAFHVVSVDNNIGAALHQIRSRIHKQGSVDIVLPVYIALQIIIPVIRGKHDRIVNLRPVNGDPSGKITVLRHDGFIFRQNRRRRFVLPLRLV